MSTADPKKLIGESEGFHLEFKSVDVLKKLSSAAREVVAFLNADGGDLWIGIAEEEGRAVKLESVPHVDREIGRLRDHLLDVVEPAVKIPGDLTLSPVDGLIRVAVEKGHQQPYALRDGGRRFLMRADARVREMTREEIADAFRSAQDAHDQVDKVVERLWRSQAEEGATRPQLWLRLVPTEGLKIDFDDPAVRKTFGEWLTDPRTTGNRPTGSTFAHDWNQPKFFPETGEVRHDRMDDGSTASLRTRVTRAGEVTFSCDRDVLYWMGNDSDPRDLWPFNILEFPISVFRLMGKILDRFANVHPALQVVAGFCISGLKGWRLRPGSPNEPAVPWLKTAAYESDVLEADPGRLVFEADEIKRRPDRQGFRLVRLVYERFGFGEKAIPREFDQQQGVLVLG